ncbi:MAG TPA: carboxypeptidase regulatory-like domain-containing protein [Vicinamibacterales bacterium]
MRPVEFRRYTSACAALLVSTTLLSGQGPAPRQSPADQGAESLPVRRVVLYKTGIGYFEHVGLVRDAQDITIRFTSAQLNDVLKSLTAIDLGKGQVTGISYNSAAPIEQRLGALRLPLHQQTTMPQLLQSLRGARVEVTRGGAAVSGRLLSVETRHEKRGDEIVDVPSFSVLTDTGDLRVFDLSPDVHVRLAERDLRQEVGRYLDVLGSAREQDVRNMVISTTGQGERRLFVSYISEVPIWKSTYRLVFPEKGNPLLQGWAIVDNTIGEDWQNVELSLVAGAPQSFIQQLSQPLFGQRPVVPLPTNVLMQPQAHGATLRGGRGTLTGSVRDASGAVIPGAMLELQAATGEVIRAVTDRNGRYQINAPAGTYRLQASLAGFQPAMTQGVIPAGETSSQNVILHVGELTEAVNVTSSDALAAPPPPPAPVPAPAEEAYSQLRDVQAAAAGGDLGELFEYRIKEPVTLQKNESALVPIVSAQITAERVSLWNRRTGSGRPLRAMWLTNTTGLTLDGGSMTIIDGNAFAGEGLVEPLKPKERRLVSYATDLGMLVEASARSAPRRISRVQVRDGIMIQETQESSTTTYQVRNEGSSAATLIVEHRLTPGWTLAPGQTPVESTPGAERFRVSVNAGQDGTLTVTEGRPGTTRIRVGEISDAHILALTASGVAVADLQRALRPVFEKRTEIAALDRRLKEIETERTRITADQQRVRENMKALRGSNEERQLLQRYTRQLDDQETRLAQLQQESARVGAERAENVAELSRRIASVTFEWDGQ